MKKFLRLLAITIANMILCLTAEAQEKFTEGKLTVDDRIFETGFSEIDTNRMWVITKLPQYENGYPLPKSPTPPLPTRDGDMKVDTIIDKTVVHEVLRDKLEELKTNGERITIHYVFGQDGNVVDISSYSLPRNTLITPKELAMIDKRLRKEVKATFKGREYLEHPVIFFGREIRF